MKITRRQMLLNLAGATGIDAPGLVARGQEFLSFGRSHGEGHSHLPALNSSIDRAPDMAGVEDGTAIYHLLVNASTNQQLGKPFRLSAAVMRLGRSDRYRVARHLSQF